MILVWDLSFAEILEPLGYVVAVAQGSGPSLLEQAVALAQNLRPHVAVVDMRLLNEYTDDRSGLQILQNLQSARCILYSAYLTPETTREVRNRYEGVSWVSKASSPQLLLDAIAELARESCAGHSDLSVRSQWSSQQIIRTIFGAGTDVPTDSVDDVLVQLFPSNKALALSVVRGEVPTVFGVSRGRSVILKALPDDLEPVMVKLAPADRIRNEVENYRLYIKDRLVGRFHAPLERVAVLWDLGGAVYSFLGSSTRTLPSFADFYRSEPNAVVILAPLRYFFVGVWSKHYNYVLPDRRISLFQAYNETLHLQEYLDEPHDQGAQVAFPGVPVSLVNPIKWILRHSSDSQLPQVRQAVTHGNLHGDNLFVDGEYAWAIDFERTGPGHILRDFIALEVDIVTRLAPLDDLAKFYEFAVTLVEPLEPSVSLHPTVQLLADTEAYKALGVIQGLRNLAYEVTHFRDVQEYYWGLLLETLFVASSSPGGI